MASDGEEDVQGEEEEDEEEEITTYPKEIEIVSSTFPDDSNYFYRSIIHWRVKWWPKTFPSCARQETGWLTLS